MHRENKNHKKSQAQIMHLYLTPLALILILLAVIFSQPSGRLLKISLILIFLSLIFNVTLDLKFKALKFLRHVRTPGNIVINGLLIYFLGRYWAPIWCLFLLPPIGIAVTSSRLKTFIVSVLLSIILILIYFIRDVDSYIYWGQVLSQVVIIIFLSLFINAITQNTE